MASSLLPTSTFVSGICIEVSHSGSSRGRWIRFQFDNICLIGKVSLAPLFVTGNDDTMRNWNPASGSGASIFVHNGAGEVRVGAVPAHFGTREELVDCTFEKMRAHYVRIDADGDRGLGFSKVEFS